MKITLPLPPNMANARWGHWAAKHRKQVAYKLRCTATHPARPEKPIVPAIVKARLYVWNLMDDDGAVARLKWVLDWLVDREIIVDDSPAHTRLGGVSQEVDRKNQRVEIEITALADEASS